MTNKTNGIMKVLNNKSTGKWCQPCEITIRLNDIDHAYAIADAISCALSDAKNGGDFNFNGKFIGHDVQCREMILSINGSDELENSESIELIYKRMISASPACGGSSEWVSVFKEMPQKIEGNKIWATDGNAQFECEFSDGFWCNISGSEFTHWMPLPPAPVQAKDGE